MKKFFLVSVFSNTTTEFRTFAICHDNPILWYAMNIQIKCKIMKTLTAIDWLIIIFMLTGLLMIYQDRFGWGWCIGFAALMMSANSGDKRNE